jgi:hypothetical protein
MTSVNKSCDADPGRPYAYSHPTGILTVFRPTSRILLKSAYVIQEAQCAVTSTSPEV